jgi:hypothetical protein
MSYGVTQVIILSAGNKEYDKDRQRTLNGTLRRVFVTIIVVGKHLSITYTECVFVALSVQHAERTRRAILPSVACPTLQHFPTSAQKRHDFFENK